MKVLVKRVDGLTLPKQARPHDAGYDVLATSDPNIVGTRLNLPADGINAWTKIDYIEYKTNLFFSPQDLIHFKEVADGGNENPIAGVTKFHLNGVSRSSIRKKNLILANSIATLDNGYRGEVLFCFKYVFQPEDYIIIPQHGITKFAAILNPDNIYKKGDLIAQLKGEANVDIEWEIVDSLDETVRGQGGFGSTS